MTARRSMSGSSLLLGLVTVVCLTLVTRRATAERQDMALHQDRGLVPGSDTTPSTAPPIAAALGAATVRDLAGQRVPIVPVGEPVIVMISSRTCPWCKKALKDIGELTAGRAVPRLTVLTLEGAAEGTPMMAAERIVGARLIGPADDQAQVQMTFRYPGTPTFLAVDRRGRIAYTMPGYPMREVMRTWVAVMTGDAPAP